MQQEASDEAIVAMIPIAIGTVMGMERRASVIQSSILEQPLKQWEDCKRK
ncbi:MAG: hypothetical protein H0X46_09855 [Bacteroidetes bacterium]|jgi:hypothetical protein|nr:hypothetical protein [Bacteroidota bacterium]